MSTKAGQLHTSNPIESLFAGVRLRTDVAKRMRRRENAPYLVFKIAQRLEHSWRPLNGGLTIMTLLLGRRPLRRRRLRARPRGGVGRLNERGAKAQMC